MKKIIILVLCLIFVLAACKPVNEPSDVQSGAVSENSEDNTAISNQDKTSTNEDETNNPDSNEASMSEEETYNPYPIVEIPNERFTKLDDKKIYNGDFITLSLPLDWICTQCRMEDGSAYYFRHPELGEKCNFTLAATFAELVPNRPTINENTEKQYLERISDRDRKDVKIHSIANEKIDGYESIKVVASYSLEDTEFIEIDYDYIFKGIALYSLYITYPASERETFEPIFESIVNSIDFITT